MLGAVCGAAAAQGRVPGAGPGGSDIRGEAEALPQVVPPAAAASTAARGILDRARPAVIQIKGFFGTNMRVVSKNGPKRGFVSSLSLRGVAPERALAFARTYLDAMRWNP